MAKKVLLGNVDLSNVSDKPQWYTLVTAFNYEEKAVNNICDSINGTIYEESVEDFYIPIKYSKERVRLADGTFKDKVHKVKGALSNYVFIKCVLDEGLWNLLRTTTGIAVIPTTGGYPVALLDEEINKMKEQQAPEGFSKDELIELQDKLNYSIM